LIDIGKDSDCFLILDSFVPAQIGLMSRDEQNVLVVSYAELKNCLEQSFGEVNMSSLLLLVNILCVP
jgi:PAB-dependent poly(A)-specific ribonuclease subunit 3